MDENEVLGISAHFDLSDFEKTFETLANKLTSVGTITEQVSRQMQKSLNDLGNTSDKEARKRRKRTCKNSLIT